MADEKSSWSKLVNSHKVSELITPNRKVVEVTSTTPVLKAFQTVVNAKVLSAPVFDESTGRYVGFIDTRDIAQYVVFMNDEKEQEKKKEQSNKLAPPPVDLNAIFDAAARMYAKPSQGITTAYLARLHKFVPVTPDDTMAKVMAHLCLSTVHRVPVVDPKTKRVVDIISQSTIVKFIHKNAGEVADLLGKTVDELLLGSRPIKGVKSNETALSCFRQMAKHNRSGLAIVDPDDGRLVGNTSASDLKLFVSNPGKHADLLERPVMDFLSVIRQADVSAAVKHPTISVRGSSTVTQVVGKLAATGIHRVFVADDSKGYVPEAVISLTDVLNYLQNAGAATKIKVDSTE